MRSSRSPTRSSASWRGSRSFRTREAQAACEAIERACKKLRIFLDELVNGAAPVPLKLFPEYETMQCGRGVKAAAPTDLFYPDLAPRAPKLGTPQVIPAAKLASYMVKQRRLYQRGLLAWLRGGDEGEGAKTMRDAIAGIEDATTQPNLRAFWWTVGALARRARRARPRVGVRREAAGRARRPADPPRGRGLGQGRRPAAPRSALLRRDQRAGGTVGAGGAEGLQARGPDPLGRGAERGPRAHPAAPARGARRARRGEGRVAQVHVGARGEPAQVEADARDRAQARRRGRQRHADEAHRLVWSSGSTRCRRRSPSRSRWSTRPGCCWPRARSRTTRA